MADVVSRLQDKLAVASGHRKPLVNFDSVPNLKGLRLLNPLYNYIAHRQTLRIMYKSFSSTEPHEFIVCPHLLKEFRNRWFLFASRQKDLVLYNLALDRIVSIEPSYMPFRDNPDFDTEHFFDNVIGVSKNIHNTPRTIKIWASAEQSQYIRTKPLHPSQLMIRQYADGTSVFKIDVVVNFELYSVLMSYGPGIKVLSPRYVAAYMHDKLMQAANYYDYDGEPGKEKDTQ